MNILLSNISFVHYFSDELVNNDPIKCAHLLLFIRIYQRIDGCVNVKYAFVRINVSNIVDTGSNIKFHLYNLIPNTLNHSY